MNNSLERYGITEDELKEILQKRENEGWTWEPWTNCSVFLLTPPEDDPRRTWGAEWIRISDDKIIPSYIFKEVKQSVKLHTEDEIKKKIEKPFNFEHKKTLSPEEIEDLKKAADFCVENGWEWGKFEHLKNVKILLPPIDSEMINWAMEWIYIDENTVVPSFIAGGEKFLREKIRK